MRYSRIFCCLFLIIQGCSTLGSYHEFLVTGEDLKCLNWFENIESQVNNHGLRDAEAERIDGFHHLRVNRFLASIAEKASSTEAFSEWLELMRQLDILGKKYELANLPDSVYQQLMAKKPIDGSASQALEYCGQRLNKSSLNNPEHKKLLLEKAQAPDSYQNWKRIFGFYPLARYIAGFSIKKLHQELDASFKIPLEKLPQRGQILRYSPPDEGDVLAEQGSAVLKLPYDNLLGIPQLKPLQLQQLTAQYAPVWEIDTCNENDKIGAVELIGDNRPRININQPSVYIAHQYTRWHDKVLLQLIYQIWFPAREKTGILDIYGGPLDSIIWRVTLNSELTPIAFDSIHGCGCYYLLFPGPGYRVVAPEDGAEPILSPKTMASILPGKRVSLRLQSRTHYLQQVYQTDESKGTQVSYRYRDLQGLRSMQKPKGRQNLYDEEGIVVASKRLERFTFWPFGIASPGAMRQWGNHAIAFIGKRHFDDPFLMEHLLERE